MATKATVTQEKKGFSSLTWAALAVLLVIAVLIPQIIKSTYWIQLLNLSMIFGICALSLNYCLGFAGQISFATAAFWGIGAYTSTLLSTRYLPQLGIPPSYGVWIGLVAAMLVCVVFGAIVGYPTLKLRGHYLAMATIGFTFIIQLFLINEQRFSNGADGIAAIPSYTLFGYVFKKESQSFYLILAFTLLMCFIAYRIKNSRTGRAFMAIRENEMAAEALGVDTTGYKILAFILSAVTAGIAGCLFAHTGSHYISPDTFSFDQSIIILAMLVLGGVGSIPGAIIGGFLLTLLPEVLRFLRDAYMAVNAAAIILIMIFMQSGIVGLATLLWNKYVKPPKAVDAETKMEISHEARVKFLSALEAKTTKTAAGARDGHILEIQNLAKHFGGLKAVDGVDMKVRRGAIHALIGPNGSGKTTILNMLSGLYVPTHGKIRFNGEEITGKRPHLIAARGAGRTFQNIRLFGNLTVLENVMIGDHHRGKANLFSAILRTPAQRAEEKKIHDNAMAMLEFVGLDHLANAQAKSLPYGRQRVLELARALVTNPDLLLLDEPAAGLNPAETDELVELLYDIVDHGITILLVEHDMNLVMSISEDISVLNFGKKIAEGDPATVESNNEVIEAYLGREEE